MILVTGGTGFIGSILVAALCDRSERVVVCDWLGNEEKWRNISKRTLEGLVAPEKLDAFLEQNAGDIEIIFHLGAISATTERDGDLIAENNFRLSCKLWTWCKDNGVRMVYASSAATYGDGEQGFVDDESLAHLSKLAPLNAYGWSKNVFDRWVAARRERGDRGPSQCVGLKFFNVYGPNEYHKGSMRSVVHQIHPYAVKREPFSLFKSHNPEYQDGGQLRDFIWVGDVVQIMMWLLDHPKVNGLFNVGTGQARSFLDLANAVYAAVGVSPMIRYRDMPEELRAKYQYFTEADMSKLRSAGYTASFTSLEEGVRQYVQNYLNKPDPFA